MRTNQRKDQLAASSTKDSNLNYAPQYRIKLNGEDLVKTYHVEVASLTVEDMLDGTGQFFFIVNDPGSRWLDQGLFDPGKKVEVAIGYAGKLSLMISGQIDSLRPDFPAQGSPRLEISGQDSPSKSSRIRKQRPFKDTSVILKYGSSLISFGLDLDMPKPGEQLLPRTIHHDQLEGPIRGRGCSIGLPDLRPGKNIELIGIGSKFSGDYHVESTTHTINDSGYTTSFEVRKTRGVRLE
jgi:phage protein D